MYATNVERAGGARDETELYIGHSRAQLIQMFVRIERKYGIQYAHDFRYTFKEHTKPNPLPKLWRKIKREIRKHIDAWQQELPLF